MAKARRPAHKVRRPTDKFQYSKLIVIVTGLLFIGVLIFCLTRNFSNVYDTSLYVTAITITGGVFGSTIVWYEKKSQTENVSKIKLQHVRDMAEIEYTIYKRKLCFQRKLGVLGQPLAEDMSDFRIDDQRHEASDRDMEYLDAKIEDSTTDPELQAYG